MCCRIFITPFNLQMAEAVLARSSFVKSKAGFWHREVDGIQIRAITASFTDILLLLDPLISTYDQHLSRRRAWSIMADVAAKYAERVNGTVEQLANVEGCIGRHQHERKVLGVYPEAPMLYQNICLGFQEAFQMPLEVFEAEPLRQGSDPSAD